MLKKLIIVVLVFNSCSLLNTDYYKNTKDPYYNYEKFWDELNDYYGLIDFKSERYLNNEFGGWAGLYEDHKKYIYNGMEERELFSVLSSVLYRLRDSHSYWLSDRAPEYYFEIPNSFDYPHPADVDWASNNGTRKASDSFGHGAYYMDIRIPSGYLKNGYYFGENLLYSGIIDFNKLKEKSPVDIKLLNIDKRYGYLYIISFIKNNGLKNLNAAQDWSEDVDLVLDYLGDIDGLIIDIRHNSGGFEGNLERILKRFVSRKRKLYTSYTRNGPYKNNYRMEEYYINPTDKGFRGDIVILTDRGTSSCGDLFALSLMDEDYVTLMGQNTHGVLSKVIARELPIGWSFRMSSGYTIGNNGKNYEEVGIKPDILIEKNKVETLYEKFPTYYYYDPIFCTAVEILDSKVTGNRSVNEILEQL